MTLAEILAHPLPAAEDCVLFMWIVSELLDELKPILASKGFAYRSHCMWDKGDPPGLGHWFRFQHEVLIVAVKGEVPAPAPGTQWKSIIRAPRA
jgi:N6-adenosine-specific RNA methylase IME4